MATTTKDGGVAELAATQHGVFTIEQLFRLGLTNRQLEHRLKSGRWIRLYRGVFALAGAPPTYERDLMAVVLAAGDGAVASHQAAAQLHGLPGFFGLCALRPYKRSRRKLASPWLFETKILLPHHVTRLNGIPITTAARTLMDLAGHFTMGRTARALDSAIAANLVTVPDLAAVHRDLARRGRHGIAIMRVLIEERGKGSLLSESELERRFLKFVNRFAIPRPDEQRWLGGERLVGRVDFLYRSANLVVEVDSRRWHSTLLDREADMQRDAELIAEGWRVLRLSWNQVVGTPDRTAKLLLAAISHTGGGKGWSGRGE